MDRIYKKNKKKISKDNFSINIIAEKAYSSFGNGENQLRCVDNCFSILNSHEYMIIRSDGNVYPCIFFFNNGPPLGNTKKQSLRQIVDNRKKNNYAESSFLNYYCKTCKLYTLCYGGCRGYSFITTGNMYKIDPRCPKSSFYLTSKYYPICPISKINLKTNRVEIRTESLLKKLN